VSIANILRKAIFILQHILILMEFTYDDQSKDKQFWIARFKVHMVWSTLLPFT